MIKKTVVIKLFLKMEVVKFNYVISKTLDEKYKEKTCFLQIHISISIYKIQNLVTLIFFLCTFDIFLKTGENFKIFYSFV